MSNTGESVLRYYILKKKELKLRVKVIVGAGNCWTKSLK